MNSRYKTFGEVLLKNIFGITMTVTFLVFILVTTYGLAKLYFINKEVAIIIYIVLGIIIVSFINAYREVKGFKSNKNSSRG